MTTETTPKKLCLIATAPSFAHMFMRDYVSLLRERGWEVTVMTPPEQSGL